MKENLVSRLSIMLLFLLVISTSLSAQELGDVNNSGNIDIVDALLIAQYYVGLNPSNFYSNVADVNCDGGIDIVDALLIAQLYVGLISQLPCAQDTATPTPVPTTTPDPGNPGEYPYSSNPYPYGITSAASN